jgi:hypothetical protein
MTDENSLGGGYAGRKLSFSINLSVGAILNLSCKSTAQFPPFTAFVMLMIILTRRNEITSNTRYRPT